MGIWKKDLLIECDNQLGKIRQVKLEMIEKLKALEIQENEILNNRRDYGIKKYIKIEERKRILDEAERLGFSRDEIERLRQYVDDWNQDTVSNETIDEFQNLEKYIEKQEPYKRNIFYKLGNANKNIGGNENGA